MASIGSSGVLFGRSIGLFVTNGSGSALELSNQADPTKQLRIRFEISASDVETPNTARIRVYNLSNQTVAEVISEYSGVILNAGYGQNAGTIFKGTVKQYRKGKERNIDSFLDIFAADGDLAYNFGIINTNAPAGTSYQQHLQQVLAAMNNAAQSIGGQSAQQITLDPNAQQFISSTGGILPRGKVMFGMARSVLRDMANTVNCRWSIQKGVLTLIPNDGFLPGEAIVINSATGMVGVPEATDQGITVRSLLNPNLQVGGQIKLNNADILATTVKQQFFPGYADFNLIATVNSGNDGLYRVVVLEYSGDTREQEWYSDIVCLSINQSPQPGTTAVLPYG